MGILNYIKPKYYEKIAKCDKTLAREAIKKVVYASDIARHGGILALEAFASNEPNEIFRNAILLNANGIYQEITLTILAKTIFLSDLTPEEICENLIYLEGALLIGTAENTSVIEIHCHEILDILSKMIVVEDKYISVINNLSLELILKITKCDKTLARDAIKKVVDVSETARYEGLPGLDKYFTDEINEFFWDAIKIMIDGCEPSAIKEMFVKYILNGDLTSEQILECVIYTDGILLIYAGETTRVVEALCYSTLGLEGIRELNEKVRIQVD